MRSFLAEESKPRTPRRGDQPADLTSDRGLYRQRTIVERASARLKQLRCVATRYDKRSHNYHAQIVFSAIII